jgi:hypothetical protein
VCCFGLTRLLSTPGWCCWFTSQEEAGALRRENLELADKVAQLTTKLEEASAAAALASTTNGNAMAASMVNSRAFKGKGAAGQGPGDATGSADVYKTLLDQVRDVVVLGGMYRMAFVEAQMHPLVQDIKQQTITCCFFGYVICRLVLATQLVPV